MASHVPAGMLSEHSQGAARRSSTTDAGTSNGARPAHGRGTSNGAGGHHAAHAVYTGPGHGTGCKYPRNEVLMLARLFAQFDQHGTGEVSAKELALAMTKSNKSFRGGGVEVFKVLVKNGEGRLKFETYLNQFYPLATAWERALMMEWAKTVMHKPPIPPDHSGNPDVLQLAIKQAGVSQAQLNEYRKMFNLFNKSGTGLLQRKELLDYAQKLGMDVQQVAELFDEVDRYHNNVLNFEQFVCMITRVNLR